MVEFEKEEKQLSKSTALIAIRPGKIKFVSVLIFFGPNIRARRAHRQPQAGSTALPQIQTGSFGEPPTPSSSDLTVALDRY